MPPNDQDVRFDSLKGILPKDLIWGNDPSLDRGSDGSHRFHSAVLAIHELNGPNASAQPLAVRCLHIEDRLRVEFGIEDRLVGSPSRDRFIGKTLDEVFARLPNAIFQVGLW